MKLRRWGKTQGENGENGGNDMENVIYNNNFKITLDKITSKLSLLDGEKGMIKLDKNNPSHKDWFEDDEE